MNLLARVSPKSAKMWLQTALPFEARSLPPIPEHRQADFFEIVRRIDCDHFVVANRNNRHFIMCTELDV